MVLFIKTGFKNFKLPLLSPREGARKITPRSQFGLLNDLNSAPKI